MTKTTDAAVILVLGTLFAVASGYLQEDDLSRFLLGFSAVYLVTGAYLVYVSEPTLRKLLVLPVVFAVLITPSSVVYFEFMDTWSWSPTTLVAILAYTVPATLFPALGVAVSREDVRATFLLFLAISAPPLSPIPIISFRSELAPLALFVIVYLYFLTLVASVPLAIAGARLNA